MQSSEEGAVRGRFERVEGRGEDEGGVGGGGAETVVVLLAGRRSILRSMMRDAFRITILGSRGWTERGTETRSSGPMGSDGTVRLYRKMGIRPLAVA